jgi:hypothetical protein
MEPQPHSTESSADTVKVNARAILSLGFGRGLLALSAGADIQVKQMKYNENQL